MSDGEMDPLEQLLWQAAILEILMRSPSYVARSALILALPPSPDDNAKEEK